MLDETIVFHKTAMGVEEHGGRERNLVPKLRRALVLVDGKSSVAALTPRFRAGEVDAILEELEDTGYITRDPAQAAPDTDRA